MMKVAVLLMLLMASSLHAAETLPQEVRAFIGLRETCEHFRGELPDPGDVERTKEVARQLGRFCRGTDRRLAALRKKYARHAAVTRRLAHYEARIEAPSQAKMGNRR
ncbi:hypothetical protein [Massilia sp. ST3]|uniref:hypothetical protein n=1 Tax=Massilia sp. ST3 TaxID=2824903 RepID=UPI001B83C041|nr:hypothetical protein [Massilia sp. ST3]MBQ5948782.1 hypothetical protein [Massilia sp. ST3]